MYYILVYMRLVCASKKDLPSTVPPSVVVRLIVECLLCP